MKYSKEEIDRAAKEAALSASIKTADERARVLGNSFFSDVIEHLKESGVDELEVEAMEKELGASTNRNETILRVIRKGGAIANTILSLLK